MACSRCLLRVVNLSVSVDTVGPPCEFRMSKFECTPQLVKERVKFWNGSPGLIYYYLWLGPRCDTTRNDDELMDNLKIRKNAKIQCGVVTI